MQRYGIFSKPQNNPAKKHRIFASRDKGGSNSTSGQIEAEGLHQPAHSSILLDQLVERLLGREQRLDLILLGQTDGDLQTAILQAFGQRGTDAALDGQRLVVEDLSPPPRSPRWDSR